MYIEEIYIEGFGVFKDESLAGLSKVLNLFIGENESGKTTLMEYIRFILFGLKSSKNDYEPLYGGKHGGRLLLNCRNEMNITIERIGRQTSISLREGGAAPFGSVEELLAGVDRATFERVFAIGLEDLQGLKAVFKEEVGGRLLSAGKGIGSASLPEAITEIEKQIAVLVNPTGKKPVINQITNSIKELQVSIKELQNRSQDYALLQSQKADLARKVKHDETSLDQLEKRSNRIAQLEQAREKWVHLCSNKEHLALLESAKNFPANGIDHLESLKKIIKETRAQTEEREISINKFESQLNGINVDEAYLQQQPAIEGLVSEIEKFESSLSDYPGVTIEKKQNENAFQKHLAELGPGWDAKRLAQVDTSFQERQFVQELDRRMDDARRKLDSAQNHKVEIERAVEDAGQALEEARSKVAAQSKPTVNLQKALEQQETLQAIGAVLNKRDIQQMQLTASEDRYKDLVRQADIISKIHRGGQPIPLWIIFLPSIMGLVLCGWLFSQQIIPAAVISLVFGVGISILLYFVLRRNSAHLSNEPDNSIQTSLEESKKSLAREIEKTKEEVEKKGKTIAQMALSCGLEVPEDEDRLQRLVIQTGKIIDQLRIQENLKNALTTCELQWKRQAERQAQAKKEFIDLNDREQKLKGEWQKWLKERDFDAKIQPKGFDTIIQIFEKARNAELNLIKSRQRLEDMETYISAARTRIQTVLSSCGEVKIGKEIGVADITKLRRSLEGALATQKKKDDIKLKIEGIRSELESSQRKLTALQTEMSGIFAEASCKDEEEFRREGAAFAEWQEYHKKYESDNLALLTIAGTPQAQIDLQRELEVTPVLQLQDEEGRLRLQETELKQVITQDNQTIGSIDLKIRQLEMDQNLGEMLLGRSNLEEKLHQNLKSWATLIVCRNLLESTRKVYEQERQPRVIKEADSVLENMTDSRYHLFFLPDSGSDIQLEDSARRRKDEIKWSSGLADQVYLSVRLSMAQEFGRNTEPIPVILDDILVKFDPRRQLGAAKVILGFASRQQVLLFSCHPEIRDIFSEASKNLKLPKKVVNYYTVANGKITNA